MIRYRWRWDDRDGQILQRFSRTIAMEAWLVGYEQPDHDDDRYAREGAMIVDLETGIRREAGCIIIGFPIDTRRLVDGHLVTIAGPMNLTLTNLLQFALPGDGSFPRQDALDFFRSLAPQPDDTVTLIQQVPATSPLLKDGAEAVRPGSLV